MMWGFGYGGEWWMAVIGVVIPILVIVGLILLAGFVLQQSGTSSRPPSTNAQQVLEERFARGEIDEDEFKRRSTTLHAQSGHA